MQIKVGAIVMLKLSMKQNGFQNKASPEKPYISGFFRCFSNIKIKEINYMKATGIVRRIDDLGRVVIPKEIRRTMRIREGDPLEIFTNRDGEVIFKKYSPIGELGNFAVQYAEALAKTAGCPVCISDKDNIIAVSGAPKKEFLDKRVSDDIERIMEEKTAFVVKSGVTKNVSVVDGTDKYNAGVIQPIISEGDSIGAVVFLNDGDITFSDTEEKLAKSASMFLGKQMEE